MSVSLCRRKISYEDLKDIHFCYWASDMNSRRFISLAVVPLVFLTVSALAEAHDKPEVHSSRVSERCYELAGQWLASLEKEQLMLAQYDFNAMAEPERLFAAMEKRRKWHYLNSIPTVYQREEGVALQDMTSEQRILAHKFIQCGLSSQGYFKAANIMIGEKVGWETLPDQGIKDSLKMGAIGGSGAYWLAIFGEPSRTEPWQWQLEGHHLALSFTMVGEEVGSTPVFWGTRPTVILKGMYAGWHLMGYEKDYAYRLMNSFDRKQKRKALIAKEMSENIFTDPNRLDVFEEYEGLPASEMTPQQQEMLRDVIREYVENNDHEIAQARMAEIEADGIENVYFSWMGPTNDLRYPIYFRVHGPSVIIEFVNAVNHGGDKGGVPLDEDGNVIPGDHNIPDSNHIHSVYRKPGADFGDDLLREHYLTDPEHQAARK
jgi:hypothetical protein